jgi:hypothetical protein
MVLARWPEERSGRMEQCEECERLWKAYQTATIESVQLYEELRSITEDQGLEKLSGTTTRAEAAERLREEARQKADRTSGGNPASVKVQRSHSFPGNRTIQCGSKSNDFGPAFS